MIFKIFTLVMLWKYVLFTACIKVEVDFYPHSFVCYVKHSKSAIYCTDFAVIECGYSSEFKLDH